MSLQAPSAVFLVRPCWFGANPETAHSNIFQEESNENPFEIRENAIAEFDAFHQKLLQANIWVISFEDTPEPRKTDAVFPNNWLSTHPDGSLVLYPMLSQVRRFERRNDIIEKLSSEFSVNRILDLSHYETEGKYLEGTGSMVIDYDRNLAFACASSRTNQELFNEFCEKQQLKGIWFRAQSPNGGEIYHTNVILSIGSRYAVVATELIAEADRSLVLSHLENSGKEIIHITFGQVKSFCGNVIEVKGKDGKAFLLCSEKAWNGFTPSQQLILSSQLEIIYAPIPSIEKYGGGSIRCMVGGIFNPPLPI